MTRPLQLQQGAVLITALMFLVILTLISITAMRSSTLELRMAGNEQEHRRALQSTQSAVNGVMAQTSIQVIDVGITNCYRFADTTDPTTLAGCTTANTTTLTSGPGYDAPNLVAANLDAITACPRSIANSARGQGSLRTSNAGTSTGNCAYFTVTSSYDDTAARGGAAETAEGVIKLIF